MSKKPLSFDEKKAKMVQLFHEKKEFFQLKELERIAPKEKGITVNSIKEVVQALVDDGIIDTDKISGSVYFWSFPSKTINIKKRKLAELEISYESSSKRLKSLKSNVTDAEADKENIDKVKEIMAEVEQLSKRKEQLQNELRSHREDDPEMLEGMKNETQAVKVAANRWTDNIFEAKSWCKRKFSIEDKVLNKQFGIAEDLDYLP